MVNKGISISELIIIPGVDTAEVAIHDFGQREVNHGRVGFADDVGGDQLVARGLEYPLPAILTFRVAENFVYLFRRGRP